MRISKEVTIILGKILKTEIRAPKSVVLIELELNSNALRPGVAATARQADGKRCECLRSNAGKSSADFIQ